MRSGGGLREAGTAFPVRYVHCTTGQSQVHNMNNCLREAACDLTLLLHDDDLLVPKSIELLAPPFEENPEVVGAYGRQISSPTRASSFLARPT